MSTRRSGRVKLHTLIMIGKVTPEPAGIYTVELELTQKRAVWDAVEAARAVQQTENGDFTLVHAPENMIGQGE